METETNDSIEIGSKMPLMITQDEAEIGILGHYFVKSGPNEWLYYWQDSKGDWFENLETYTDHQVGA